jgi:hypothetical protein
MLIDQEVRGSVVKLSAFFEAPDGVPEEPASAVVHVNYIDANGMRVEDTLPMEEDSTGEWVALWNSSVANKGRVFWSVEAFDPPTRQDGVFELVANLANPDPEATT